MSFISKIISSTYPLRMKISKFTGMGISKFENKNHLAPIESFYSLSATLNNGEVISFDTYKGKKILLVNVASKCGYTPQYAELEELNQQNTSLVILGFPANNFGGQEPAGDKEIAKFCEVNFGVTFPIFKKNDVVGKSKQEVYQWLTDKNKNGWNDEEPKWNFYKYLVDREGRLIAVYSSSVSPLDIEMLQIAST